MVSDSPVRVGAGEVDATAGPAPLRREDRGGIAGRAFRRVDSSGLGAKGSGRADRAKVDVGLGLSPAADL